MILNRKLYWLVFLLFLVEGGLSSCNEKSTDTNVVNSISDDILSDSLSVYSKLSRLNFGSMDGKSFALHEVSLGDENLIFLFTEDHCRACIYDCLDILCDEEVQSKYSTVIVLAKFAKLRQVKILKNEIFQNYCNLEFYNLSQENEAMEVSATEIFGGRPKYVSMDREWRVLRFHHCVEMDSIEKPKYVSFLVD